MMRILRAVPVTWGLMVAATAYGAFSGHLPRLVETSLAGMAGWGVYAGLAQWIRDIERDDNDNR